MSMNKTIDLKSLDVLPFLKKYSGKVSRHAVFGAVVIVLLIYVIIVLKINSLSNAEPSPDQEVVVTASTPRIDASAIKQIQALEDNNTDIHSLFEQARNNPFSE